jgi:hypothetical protein
VKHYDIFTKPPNNLLKKNKFLWSTSAIQDFIALKKIMIETPVLVIHDFTEGFVVETNVCAIGIMLWRGL